jgi:hypothetical protein
VDANPPDQPADGAGSSAGNGTDDGADERPRVTVFQPWSSAFVRHAALWLIAAIVGGLFLERLADSLAHRLAGIFQLKLTAKTMDVPAPIAFAAALIGGALGGFLFAFLSLPVAGIIQSVIRSYGHRYEVVEEAGAGDQADDQT